MTDSQPLVGQIISQYRVIERLGGGGMGVVYKAEDTKLGRMVALKFLPDDVSQDKLALDRFLREARAAAALNHPNILAIYDVGFDGSVPYIVSELLEGKNLRQRLTEGPLPVREAEDYALQIAHGLTAAHERLIVHRDLKPENLFRTVDGRVKILDFGVAKLQTPALSAKDAFATGPRYVGSATDQAARAVASARGGAGGGPELRRTAIRARPGNLPRRRDRKFGADAALDARVPVAPRVVHQGLL